MRSFLETIEDNGLTWDKDEDNDDSSASSYTTSDDEDDNDSIQANQNDPVDPNNNNGNRNNRQDNEDAPGFVFVDHEDANDAINLANEVFGNDGPALLVADRINNDDGNNIIVGPGSFNRVMELLKNHPNSQQIIFRVARSEVETLVRAEINWETLKKQIKTYPGPEVGDDRSSHLLQGILRMDPPLDVVQECLHEFPQSCIDMDSFFAACQYATSEEESDNEIVELVMRYTMAARQREGIQWGMLAFLGDARIRVRHAKLLLQNIPGAITDPSHGVFGVSPLDRMLSGAFIHGDDTVWVEKLKLALLTAEKGSLDKNVPLELKGFLTFHALIRRLVSPDFMGVQFGAFTFIRTLFACMRSDTCLMHGQDQSGRLPIHVALEEECFTHLGTSGERKLIKFLLQFSPQSAMAENGKGILPLRLAIENGWPCYDIILDSAPEALETRDANGNLSIHVALSGKCHPSFGVAGAREIVRCILKKSPRSAKIPDSKGRLPLQLALEHGWPCHDILIAAAPSALESRDINTMFYPFQTAACAFETTEDRHKDLSLRELSLLYELIREAPLMLHGLALSSEGDGQDIVATVAAAAEVEEKETTIEMRTDEVLETPSRKRKLET